MSEYAPEHFWVQYREYVEASRDIHLSALIAFHVQAGRTWIDFGCGECCEGAQLLVPEHYIGVDQVPGLPDVREPRTALRLSHDYRGQLDTIADAVHVDGRLPDTFCSLFSIEITADASTNDALYRKIFEKFPSIEYGIVAGFYYSDRRSMRLVEEPGGLLSHQTVHDLVPHDHPVYSEERHLIRNPSKLFGPHVVEVWRKLTRKA
jgi:hypothetical protein